MQRLIGPVTLQDVNSFYVSAERAFYPGLNGVLAICLKTQKARPNAND